MIIEDKIIEDLYELMERLKSIHANNMTATVGTYKDCEVRVMLVRPQEEDKRAIEKQK